MPSVNILPTTSSMTWSAEHMSVMVGSPFTNTRTEFSVWTWPAVSLQIPSGVTRV